MRIALICLALLVCSPAAAQEREVPYWASIKAAQLNLRVGPGRDFPIRWVYRRPGLPLKVVRVHQGWRLVRDPAGDEGWVTANLLSRERGAIVIGRGLAAMREKPSDGARVRWKAEPGVVGMIPDCDEGWCRFEVGGRVGHVRAARLWGAGEP